MSRRGTSKGFERATYARDGVQSLVNGDDAYRRALAEARRTCGGVLPQEKRRAKGSKRRCLDVFDDYTNVLDLPRSSLRRWRRRKRSGSVERWVSLEETETSTLLPVLLALLPLRGQCRLTHWTTRASATLRLQRTGFERDEASHLVSREEKGRRSAACNRANGLGADSEHLQTDDPHGRVVGKRELKEQLSMGSWSRRKEKERSLLRKGRRPARSALLLENGC